MIVSIDFETYSDVDIKVVGGDVYARHPSTRVICMAYCVDGEVELTTEPNEMRSVIERATEIRAWNAQFEMGIIRHVLKMPIANERFQDTMLDAAACNWPQSLGACAVAMGLPVDQQKDKAGKLLITQLCKPSKWTTEYCVPSHKRHGEYLEKCKQLEDYCRQDVVTEMAILAKLPKRVEGAERSVLLKTWEINQRGIPVSVDECKFINGLVEIANERLIAKCVELCGVEPTKRAQIVAWMAEQGVVTSSIDAEHVANLLADTEVPEVVKEVLRIRSSVASTSLAKYQTMLDIQSEGRVRNLYVFHGASTGRWASRGGLNAQNFPRPPFKTQDEIDQAHLLLRAYDSVNFYGDRFHDAAISCLRGMIKAPEGKIFVDADFSSIENRVSAWLAGQLDVVAQFAAGLDEYRAFAVLLYQLESIEQVTSTQRQVAKSAVLGCMFGQGSRGLVEYAAGMGVTLTQEDAARIVAQYRETYRKVKQMWYACGTAAAEAIRNPGLPVPCGRLLFKFTKGALWMKLPSGRLIAWQGARLVRGRTPWGDETDVINYMGLDRFTHKWRQGIELIGSSIFQSAVQAIARDCLAEAALQFDDIVMLTHDEIMREVPIADAEKEAARMEKIMSTTPKWATGLPIACELWTANRFRK